MASERAHQTDEPGWRTLIDRVRRIEQRCWTAGERDAAEPTAEGAAAWLATGWRIGDAAAQAETPADGIEGAGGSAAGRPAGRDEPDAGEVALRRGGLHEWFAMAPARDTDTDADVADRSSPRRRRPRMGSSATPWPPLCVLGHLAGRALAEHAGSGWVMWIGRGCWPHGRLLWRDCEEGLGLLRRSVFIDPGTDAERLWAIEVALRSRAVAAVVADGEGLEMGATRRVQLAARAGDSPALLARPPSERGALSAAVSRWSVAPMPTAGDRPRWRIELLRCKEAAHATDGALVSPRVGRRFVVEWNHAPGLVAVPAELCDRSGAPPTPPRIAEAGHVDAGGSVGPWDRARASARRTA